MRESELTGEAGLRPDFGVLFFVVLPFTFCSLTVEFDRGNLAACGAIGIYPSFIPIVQASVPRGAKSEYDFATGTRSAKSEVISSEKF